MLAFIDGIAMAIHVIFDYSPQIHWLFFHYLALVMLFRDKFFEKKNLYLSGLVPIIIMTFVFDRDIHVFLCFVIHLLIFLLFTKEFIIHYFEKNIFDIFYLLILFYETLNIFKLLAFMREIIVGIEIYYVATLVQIFIGILLIFIQIRSNRVLPAES